MVLGIIFSSLFALENLGVHVVGDIPAGLAPPKLPGLTVDQWLLLLPAALGLALVNFAESYGPSRNFAAKHNYEIDANQELVGLGAANVGAGLFQGFPIGSSLSKSAANDRAGAKTPVALIVCAVLTIAVALFFTPFFAPLPEAVLAAVVLVALSGMVKVEEIRRLYRLNRVDFALAIVTVLGVLTFEALQGLMIAVILSLLALIWRASQSKLSVLGREPGSLVYSDVRRHPKNRTLPGLLIVRPDEGLFFANTDTLRNEIITTVDDAKPLARVTLLNLEMSNQIDVPSMDMLVELKGELEQRGTQLWLARLHGPVFDDLEQSGVLNEIGLEKVYPRMFAGTLDYLLQVAPVSMAELDEVKNELNLSIEIVDLLLSRPSGEARRELEDYRQKLVDLKLQLNG
jgi:SulP family sulfate permease